MWQRVWWHTVKTPGTLSIENVVDRDLFVDAGK